MSAVEEEVLPDFGGGGFVLDPLENLESEGDGVSGTAPGYDASVGDGWFAHEDSALAAGNGLEAVEAGEFLAFPDVKLAQHKSGGRADGRDGSAGGVVFLERLYQGLAGGEVPGPGHTAGQYHHVPEVRTFVADLHLVEEIVYAEGDAVGTGNERLVEYGYEIDLDTTSPEDIERT